LRTVAHVRALVVLLVCLVPSLLGQASTAHASPLFELTGGNFGQGGLSARTTGASASSAYFNPALLPRARQGVELGVVMVNDAISIDVAGKSPARDVPASAVGRFGTAFPSVPTDWLEQGCDPAKGESCVSRVPAVPRQSRGSSGNVRLYQSIGFVAHVVPRRLTLGLYALVPYRAFTQAHSFFVDEREQFYTNSLHPEMYSDRLTPVSLAFAWGSQITDWLSIGMSFTLSLQNRANALAYVGNSADVAESLQLSTRVDVNTSVSPHGAVVLTPIDDLDIALTVHSPQKLVIDTQFGIFLPNGDLQRASRPATHDYVPWIVGLGVNYDVLHARRTKLSLVLSTTYERWSQYVNRQSERPLPGYEFKDVWAGTAGLRALREDSLGFLFDVTYHPTPVPLQTGRTNYVDNNRIGFVLGTSYDMPVPAWKLAFRFGAQAQLHVLPKRSQVKRSPSRADRTASDVRDEWDDTAVDIRTNAILPEAAGLQTNNPGYPGFSSQGVVVGGTLSTALLY